MEVVMRIMYLSTSDSGNQGFLLCRAMREHLGWEAMSLQSVNSYLDYEYDWLDGHVSDNEVIDFAKGVDFFIMQDQYLQQGLLSKYITRKNSCIHGLGTPLRKMLPTKLINQLRLHSLIVPPAPDPTITPHLLATAFFESLIINVDKIDKLVEGVQKNSELTVCCAVSQKKEKFIEEARIKIEDLGIRFETVTQTSWRDTIKAKARAHIILDPPSDDVCPSMNTMEAIYMGSIPVGPYSAWGYSIHPELEQYAESYNQEVRENGSIYDAVKETQEWWNENKSTYKYKNKNPIEMKDQDSWARQEWIRYNYSPQRVVARWKWWLTWAMKRG